MNKTEINFLERLCTSKNRIDKVPKGFYTLSQISERLNVSLSNAERRVRYALRFEPKKIQVETFCIKTGSRIIKVKHYKFTKK